VSLVNGLFGLSTNLWTHAMPDQPVMKGG